MRSGSLRRFLQQTVPLTRIRQAFTDALFPKICPGCGGFVKPGGFFPGDGPENDPTGTWAESTFRQVTTDWLCRPCRDRFVPIVPPACACCGQQFATRAGSDHLCGSCIQRKKAFGSARAAGQYDGPLMALIHAYKYRGKIHLARPLGALLHRLFLRHYAEAGLDCAIPVPLHRKKLRQRGFDQVLLLLDHWRRMEAPGAFDLPVEENLLVRTRYTESQTGLGKKERRQNIRNAFAVTNTDRVRNRRVLLVDDVYTTGATLEECAGVLVRAGAAEVFVLTLARAM